MERERKGVTLHPPINPTEEDILKEVETHAWEFIDFIGSGRGNATTPFKLLSYFRDDPAPANKNGSLKKLLQTAGIKGEVTLETFFSYQSLNHAVGVEGNASMSLERMLVYRHAAEYIFKQNNEQKNQFAESIVSQSEALKHLTSILNQLFLHKKPSPRKYTYFEAQNLAAAEARARFGDDLDTMFMQNPSIRKSFLQKVNWYEETESPVTARKPLTIEEATLMLAHTYVTEQKQFIEDLVNEGTSVPLWYTKTQTTGRTISETFESIPLTKDNLKDFTIKFNTFNGRCVCYLNGERVNLSMEGFERLRTLSPLDEKKQLLNSIYSNYKELKPAQIKSFFEKVATLNMFEIYEALLFKLSYISSKVDAKTPFEDLFSLEKSFPPAAWIEYFLDKQVVHDKSFADIFSIVQDLAENPAKLLVRDFAENDLTSFESIQNPDRNSIRLFSISYQSILDFVKWKTILAATDQNPLRGIHSRKKTDKRGFMATTQGLFGSIPEPFTLDNPYISNLFGKISSRTFNLPNSLMLEELKGILKPNFVITGHPLKHAKALGNISELSVYPDEWELPFENYDLSNGKNSDQITIKPTKPILVGYDETGRKTARIYAPEYARVQSLEVYSGEKQLTIDKDYQVEYEGRTGHYRLVFTDKGYNRLDSFGNTIRYIVGISPEEEVENTPKKVDSLTITQIDKALEFADKLAGQNYTRFAESLRNTIFQSLEKRGKLTAKDLEKALAHAAVYTYSDNLATTSPKDPYSEQFPYLPYPEDDGTILIQCGQAAKLFSETLNFIYGEDLFHPSYMLRTFNVGFGRMSAGHIYHADTRGSVNGVRIRHDSTPSPAPLDQLKQIPTLSEKEENYLQIPISEFRERDLSNIAKRIADSYVKKVLELTPKDKSGQVPVNFNFPFAITQLGKVFKDFEDNARYLYEDSEKKADLVSGLESVKETWSESLKQLDERRGPAFNQTFGQYFPYSSYFIANIDQALKTLKSI
ncbi:MAG: hypothetical protein Q7R49_01335 [Candidatus Daviesbacteria bacterium]|nr:hypothetical protein [Candidatus Daviesbacteria bacterium]